MCSPGIALALPIISSFVYSSRPEGQNGIATSIVLTLTTVPALKNATAISIHENVTTALTPTTNPDNSGVDNSSGKTWHTVETWSLFLAPIALFPSKDLLQSLHDVFDKIDDGSDDPDDPDIEVRNNVQTVHNMTVRFKRRFHKLRKKGAYFLTKALSRSRRFRDKYG